MSADPFAAGAMVLDDEARLALAGGDAALAAELLDIFRRDILPGAAAIAACVEAADRSHLAHKLRGAALAIGAREVADLALRIEAGNAPTADLLVAWAGALGRLGAALDAAAARGAAG